MQQKKMKLLQLFLFIRCAFSIRNINYFEPTIIRTLVDETCNVLKEKLKSSDYIRSSIKPRRINDIVILELFNDRFAITSYEPGINFEKSCIANYAFNDKDDSIVNSIVSKITEISKGTPRDILYISYSSNNTDANKELIVTKEQKEKAIEELKRNLTALGNRFMRYPYKSRDNVSSSVEDPFNVSLKFNEEEYEYVVELNYETIKSFMEILIKKMDGLIQESSAKFAGKHKLKIDLKEKKTDIFVLTVLEIVSQMNGVQAFNLLRPENNSFLLTDLASIVFDKTSFESEFKKMMLNSSNEDVKSLFDLFKSSNLEKLTETKEMELKNIPAEINNEDDRTNFANVVYVLMKQLHSDENLSIYPYFNFFLKVFTMLTKDFKVIIDIVLSENIKSSKEYDNLIINCHVNSIFYFKDLLESFSKWLVTKIIDENFKSEQETFLSLEKECLEIFKIEREKSPVEFSLLAKELLQVKINEEANEKKDN